MVENNIIIIEWIGIILALVFGVTMFCQGHFIIHNKNGYSRKDSERQEARDQVRRQVEKILRGDSKDDLSP